MSVEQGAIYTRATPDPADKTIGGWLLGDRDASAAAEQVLRTRRSGRRQALRGLTEAGRRALANELVHALRTGCGDRIADIVLEGWRQHRALTDAADATVSKPGLRQLVTMTTHDLTFDQQMALELRSDGVRIATMHAQVDLTIHVMDVIAVVEDGRLVALQAGNAGVVGRVLLEGEVIAYRETTLPLVARLRLGSGVPLRAGALDA